MTDSELLIEYSGKRSQGAFAALVERYVRLVHSACWRQLGDQQLAEDATQMVFMLLSQKAGKLQHTELAGWLLTSARYTCANIKRSQQRRQRRQQAVAMSEITHTTESNSDLLQMLDEALLRLRSADRTALVLRYLQGEPLRQVGEALGLSEDAARKRVDRGLEKLRQIFRDRGIQADSVALAAVLTHIPQFAMRETLASQIVHAVKR